MCQGNFESDGKLEKIEAKALENTEEVNPLEGEINTFETCNGTENLNEVTEANELTKPNIEMNVCSCSGSCGSNYSYGGCSCSGSCGSNYHK